MLWIALLLGLIWVVRSEGYGSIRSDYYLDPAKYKENEFEIPKDSWRVHIVGSVESSFTGAITSITINSIEGYDLYKGDNFTYFDWFRGYYSENQNQYWISFHSRYKKWFNDRIVRFFISITDSTGISYQDNCSVVVDHPLKISYVTTRNSGSEYLVHLHNFDELHSYSISSVFVDGKEFSVPVELSSGEHHVFSIEPPTKKSRGDIWTVSLKVNNSQSIGNGGKIISEAMPIESWPHSSECPFPDTKGQKTYEAYVKSSINSAYFHDSGMEKACAIKLDDYFENVLPKYPNYYAFLSTDDNFKGIKNFDQVFVRFLGDEPDPSKDYLQNLREILRNQVDTDKNYPTLPTYVGGSTNRRSGLFSGVTDVKGIDAYVAACAPCIIPVIHEEDITVSYAYSLNLRNNHMPNPAITYSQLYSGAWSYQPHEDEIYLQIMSAIMAGSKGIMLFQGIVDDFPSDYYDTVGKLLNSVEFLADEIREGDIESMQVHFHDTKERKKVLVETIRNDERLVIMFQSIDVWGYSQLSCHIEMFKHWKFREWKISKGVKFSSEQVRNVTGITEVVGGQRIGVQGEAEVNFANGEVLVNKVTFSSDRPFRIFIMDYR